MDGTPRRWPYSWLPRQAIEKTKSLAATLPGGNSGKTQLPLIPENASAGYCPPSQACCSSKPALCSSEVTTPAQDEVLRFGEFELRPATGELRHLSAAGPAQPQRLPPQPARLLEILVRKQGALATREAPTRIAIVPFELAASEPIRHHDLAKISEWLVAELSSGWQGRLEVIGPRSTAAYDAKPFSRHRWSSPRLRARLRPQRSRPRRRRIERPPGRAHSCRQWRPSLGPVLRDPRALAGDGHDGARTE